MKKMERSQHITYLDTTPEQSTNDFEKLGIGVSEYAIEYGATVDSEKWIIEETARHDHTSNEKTGAVEQKIYIDDPCYQFVKKAKGKKNYQTKILDIDMTSENENGSYEAELSDGMVVVNSYLGSDAVISYTLYYEGDAKEGTVSMQSGKPVFTPKVS